MANGYAGQILRVNLSTKGVAKQPLSEELIQEFVGGRGFVAKLLWDELPPGTDPLGEDNMVVMAAGPLTGLFVPGSGKTHFGTKSPATGGYGDSNMGGHFAPTMKYAGYDVIIVTGKAAGPSILVVDDSRVEVRDGAEYWGMGAIDCEKALKDDLGEEFQIITVGPAAEKLVKYACISHDFGRQAGRTGVGTVFGSKNLKAVAVRGTGTIPVVDPAGALEKGKAMYQSCYNKPGFQGWTPFGTAGITDWVNEVGAFPTRNFQTSYFKKYKEINGAALREKILVTDKGCFGCPIPCGKYSRARTKLGQVTVEGPEYETIALLGGNCSLDKIEEVAYANYICDQLGIDTISGGAVVSFAVECFEKGLLSETQIGRKIAFGDLESIVYLLEKIATREGIGDLLAEGVRTAAARIGGGSDKFAIHIKGLEWSGYECRNAPGMMLSYMTADVGAHHNRAWALGFDISGGSGSVTDLIQGKGERPASLSVFDPAAYAAKVDKVIELQHMRPMFDLLGVCRLQWVEIGMEVSHYEEIMPLISGKQMSLADLLVVSERVWNLTRAFSAREIPGFGRSFDYPPGRFLEERIPDGPSAGRVMSKEEADWLLDEYYRKRGWDENGLPTAATLEGLGLGFAAETAASRAK